MAAPIALSSLVIKLALNPIGLALETVQNTQNNANVWDRVDCLHDLATTLHHATLAIKNTPDLSPIINFDGIIQILDLALETLRNIESDLIQTTCDYSAVQDRLTGVDMALKRCAGMLERVVEGVKLQHSEATVTSVKDIHNNLIVIEDLLWQHAQVTRNRRKIAVNFRCAGLPYAQMHCGVLPPDAVGRDIHQLILDESFKESPPECIKLYKVMAGMTPLTKSGKTWVALGEDDLLSDVVLEARGEKWHVEYTTGSEDRLIIIKEPEHALPIGRREFDLGAPLNEIVRRHLKPSPGRVEIKSAKDILTGLNVDRSIIPQLALDNKVRAFLDIDCQYST